MSGVDLLQKYNVPVPRYTSYPTVPYWKNEVSHAEWQSAFTRRFHIGNKLEGISLYIHLPFCESLCTYCGCNKKITTNHSVEEVYMQALLQEWRAYLRLMGEPPLLRELHLGGGTPTFFSPENLGRMLTEILESCSISPAHEFSLEGHPNNTTREHLQVLYELGFRRVSYGVQDNDPEVQRVINRVQPFSNVVNATLMARSVGFTSVNFDLIYGLPLQEPVNMTKTIQECISLRPDRVAFYSYAHVPWTSRGQRLFDESDLPDAARKMQLYRIGKELFTAAGYQDVGMDHFALPGDALHTAHTRGRLHRNFMGYTTQHTSLLLGLGVSAISDAGDAFVQNEKTLAGYYAAVQAGRLPVHKGYMLSDEDVDFRRYILDISCRGRTSFQQRHLPVLKEVVFPVLQSFREDGLVAYDDAGACVTALGRNFLRNVCSAFDLHLQRGRSGQPSQLFSKAI
ncbi:MAG: oxygen-independent coproporphyrinogen III oxidase [Flavipsychrobacter sp.]|nr:oxygen-independent coproporphyrinogen III oxidase [Flavipsychrobacter sp.]